MLFSFYWISTQIDSEKEKNLIFTSIAIASLLSGIYGAMQYFGFDFISWAIQWGNRPGSTFGNPNFAAGWWVMTIPLLGIKFFNQKNKLRWIWLLLSLLMAMNLVWGKTRGAWIAEIFALAFVFGLWVFIQITKNLKDKIFYLIHLLFIIIVFSVIAVAGKYQINKIQNTSVQERVFKWKTAMRMIKANPLFGVGAGHLKVNFALYQAEVKKEMKLQMKGTSESNVHNEFFQLWAEMGTLGLASFLFIFILWYFRILIYRNELLEKNNMEKWGSISAIFAFFFFCLTNFPLHIVPNASLLIFLLASFEFKSEKSIVQTEQKSNFFIRIGAGIIFVLIFLKWILPSFMAEQYRLKAEEFQNQKNYGKAIEFYQKAVKSDFYNSERTAYDLGECYRAVGDYPNSIKAYEISTQLRNYGEVYNNIGNCYYLLNNKSETVKNWEKAVELGLPDPQVQTEVQNNLKILKQTLSQ